MHFTALNSKKNQQYKHELRRYNHHSRLDNLLYSTTCNNSCTEVVQIKPNVFRDSYKDIRNSSQHCKVSITVSKLTKAALYSFYFRKSTLKLKGIIIYSVANFTIPFFRLKWIPYIETSVFVPEKRINFKILALFYATRDSQLTCTKLSSRFPGRIPPNSSA